MEVDSLSYIDTEYDDPYVQEAVHALISAEMRTFAPPISNYLAHLPYPKLKFSNSPALEAEFARVSKGQLLEKFDTRRYSVEKPEPSLENDVQAWKRAVNNAKAQFEHQENRLTNLELQEKHVAPIFLNNNLAQEKCNEAFVQRTANVTREIQQINLQRKHAQELVGTVLGKMNHRRDEAIMKCHQINATCGYLESQIDLLERQHKVPKVEEEVV